MLSFICKATFLTKIPQICISILRVIFLLFTRVNSNWGLWTVGAAVESVPITYIFIPEIPSVHFNYGLWIGQNHFTLCSFHHLFIQNLQLFICWCVLFLFLGWPPPLRLSKKANKPQNMRDSFLVWVKIWEAGVGEESVRRGWGGSARISFGSWLTTDKP